MATGRDVGRLEVFLVEDGNHNLTKRWRVPLDPDVPIIDLKRALELTVGDEYVSYNHHHHHHHHLRHHHHHHVCLCRSEKSPTHIHTVGSYFNTI